MKLAMKSWLELRPRLLIACGVWLFLLIVFATIGNRHRSDADLFRSLATVDVVMLMCFGALLAGSGVMTQSCGMASARMTDSVLFTLSLPVSRRRLFLSRAMMGALPLPPLVVAFWVLLPLFAGQHRPAPWAIAGALPFQFLGALLGYAAALLGLTALSENVFSLLIGMAGGIAGLGTGLSWRPLNACFDFLSGAAYVMSGQVHWAGVAACVLLSCLLIAGAVRTIERREF